MFIVTRAVYENGVLHPIEDLDLPEHQALLLTIQPLPLTEVKPQTLADILGFDPDDDQALRHSGEEHRLALLKMARSTRAASEPPHDGSIHHDKYLYGDPLR